MLRYKRYLPVTCKNVNESFIFHSSYFRISSNPNAINITTVHDFTYEYFYHGLHKWIHCWQKYYAIRKSKYVVCISENTKKDLLNFLPDVDEKKIHVIYNGVSDDYYPWKVRQVLIYHIVINLIYYLWESEGLIKILN